MLLHQLPQLQQVEDVGVDLQAAGEPGARETAGVAGDGHDHVAVPDEADLGCGVAGASLPDRLRAVRAEPGYERHPEIRDLAAECPVRQEGGTIFRFHVRNASRKAFQCFTAFFRCRHPDLAFKVILRPTPPGWSPGADSAAGSPARCAVAVLEGGSVPGTAASRIGARGVMADGAT